MSILANDPLTQLSSSVYENKGVFALLLGSGLSRAAEIPTGWETTLDLIRRVAEAQGLVRRVRLRRFYSSHLRLRLHPTLAVAGPCRYNS